MATAAKECRRNVTRAVRWSGRLLVVAGAALWLAWLGWRVSSPIHGLVGILVLVLELAALTAAVLVAAALWPAPNRSATTSERRASLRRTAQLPVTMSVALGTSPAVTAVGADDTGEVAWARCGVRSLASRSDRPTISEIGWAVIALEGMRRMAFVSVLALVLFTGRFPFDVPRWQVWALLVGAQVLFAVGIYLLSDGLIRPGARLRWSMASVGAGLGDGTSRTGLPIRWMATLATMVTLNVAVSLRGLSDRWTHGLGAMPRDQRVIAMAVAAWLVGWGFVALRTLPQPTLGFYGATRRLEETSTRRLALGGTLAVAAIGMLAGVLPGGVPG